MQTKQAQELGDVDSVNAFLDQGKLTLDRFATKALLHHRLPVMKIGALKGNMLK